MAPAMYRLAPFLFVAALPAYEHRSDPHLQRVAVATTERDTAWYRGTRTLDLTDDGRPDSIVMTAYGRRGDSLLIVLVFLVNGREAYRFTWPSAYELVDPDLPDTMQATVDAYIRDRLRYVLARITIEPLDTASLRETHLSSFAVRSLRPLPAHEVVFSYGYESTLFLAWDSRTKRFVELAYSD